MNKIISLLLAALLLCMPVLALASGITVEGTYTDGTYTAQAEGFAGPLTVEVTIAGGAITAVTLLETADTEGIYNTAVDSVIPAIIEANTVSGVDAKSGATYSSNGILTAVADALAQAGATVTLPQADADAEVEIAAPEAGIVYAGIGSVPNFRVGPGKDSAEVQVYSFNVVFAAGLFDEEGRILNLDVDIYEVSTPNYDGASMPHFSGWPGKEGYNVTDHASATVSGVSDNTEESIAAEVNGWLTKRERGADYGMNAQNEWNKQMDFYEAKFVGWTLDEVQAWFDAYTSKRNGRPIKLNSENEDDIAALATFTQEEKDALADVTAGATMSLSDSHGDILGAIRKAFENRQPALSLGE
ncbi:MAG: FMN-binding protein [Candidatus Limiplasma sp.]|nr:FMN-binding protein [Candidatus Limiplasma sp.]